MGIINIKNLSLNPYSLYQGDALLFTIEGKETLTRTLALGEYSFKAVQKSGFLMYATVNHRGANLTLAGEEVNMEIGCED